MFRTYEMMIPLRSDRAGGFQEKLMIVGDGLVPAKLSGKPDGTVTRHTHKSH